jgi:hypothetical protein
MAASSTARSRRCRQRKRDGMVRLTIWEKEAAIGNLLAHHDCFRRTAPTTVTN